MKRPTHVTGNRQGALWTRTGLYERPQHSTKRKKSEKRQRTARVTVRLLPSEYAALAAEARKAYVSIPELVRSAMCGACDSEFTIDT